MDEVERREREAVVAVARSFLKTPYHDCGCVKGPNGGVDCGTLLKMVYEEAGLEHEVDVGAYSPQWFLHQDAEHYLGIITRFCREIGEHDSLPGDIVVYQWGRLFAHGGIIVDPGFPSIIHAYKPSGCVVEGEGDRGPVSKLKDGRVRPRRFFRRKAWSG